MGHWLNRIVAEIRETLEDDDELSMLYDEQGEAYIVANIELLCVLSEKYGTKPSLKSEEVIYWEETYLEAYDQREGVNTNDQRKIVIQNTFDWLKKILANRQL